MAAAIKQATGIEAELIRGSGGIFLVEVDGVAVARKTRELGFPDDDDVVRAVAGAVA